MKALHVDQVVEAARGRPVRLFLDFDGTLSPNRPDGENAEPLPAAREALGRLARVPNARVCVVTGRSVADVRRRLGVWGISYAGNHGLVIEGPEETFEHPLSKVASRAIAAAGDLLRERLKGRPGARISQNGLSLSVDIGMMDADGRRAAAEVVEASTPELAWLRLRWQTGYLGWDLIPELGWDKGDAVAHLLRGQEHVLPIAVGDGLSDEPMFARVGADGLAIRVGYAERSKARHWVRGPWDVARMLLALSRLSN